MISVHIISCPGSYLFPAADRIIPLTAAYKTPATGQMIQVLSHRNVTKLTPRYAAVITDQNIPAIWPNRLFASLFSTQ